MKISYVPVGQISGLIPALLPYLTKSEQWSDGRVSVDDLLRLMLNDLLQLWVVHEETTIHGFFGVEVKQYPQAKMLTVQYCAMETGTGCGRQSDDGHSRRCCQEIRLCWRRVYWPSRLEENCSRPRVQRAKRHVPKVL